MKLFVSILALSLSYLCHGQSLNFGIGYDYLYAKQFDNLIQTYNYSRPFLNEKQPLLSHGFSSNISYLFKSKKQFSSGIAINFSRTSSKTKNDNLNINLSFNTLELGYLVHCENRDKFGDFFGELGLNLMTGLLNKKVNNESYVIDDAKVKSLHIGASFSLTAGYWFKLNEKLNIAPKVGFHYAPYLTEGTSETVINQTTSLVKEQCNALLKFDVGVLVQIWNKR